jgi:hypothetical protein
MNKNENKNNFFIYVAFSSSNLINNLHHIIASSYFKFYTESLDFESIFKRLEFLKARRLIIINVINADCKNKFDKYNHDYNTQFAVYNISHKEFFTKEALNLLLLKNHNNSRFMIFHFENQTWANLLLNFRRFDIIVSGGSNTKRHILSPIQLRLAQFIVCLEGISSSGVVESFKLDLKSSTRMGIDLTKKEIKDSMPLIEDFKTVEDLNKQSSDNNTYGK